ncbi:hypothetical protein VYU27_008764 [Nannochloropsis oceanica]
MTSFLKGVREYVYPVLDKSAFLERGVLTPQEFVQAGDQLVYRCPTWSWEGGDPSKAKSYLPLDKQYLQTRNVPCGQRASVFEDEYEEEEEVEGGMEGGMGEEKDGVDGAWMATHVKKGGRGGRRNGGEEEEEGVVITLGRDDGEGEREGGMLPRREGKGEGAAGEKEEGGNGVLLGGVGSTLKVVDGHFALKEQEGKEGEVPREGGVEGEGSDEGYADMASYEEAGLGGQEGGEEGREGGEDVAMLPSESLPYMKTEEPQASLVASRSYDISITYDKYYQTPRAWLLGYDEEGQPLSAPALFEDIQQDYAHRTVTIETHPHTGVPQASIHPCQHANVMKNIVRNLSQGREGGREGGGPRMDQYLFIFLKFLQSMIPTIDYDFTVEVDVGTGAREGGKVEDEGIVMVLEEIMEG